MATERKAELPSGTLRYLEWGSADAPTVVLVHGFTQTADSWREFGDRLAEVGYHVVACDLRGHGRSFWPKEANYSRDAMKEDVIHLCRKLQLTSVGLVGMSMGAGLSTAIAVSAPDLVRSLVLVDWAPWPEDGSGTGKATIGVKRIGMVFMRKWPSFEAAVAEMHKFNPRRSKEGIAERLQYQLRQLPAAEGGKWAWATDPRIMRDADTRAAEPPSVMWDAVRRVHCPTLVVRGAVSDVLEPKQAIRLAETLPRPHSRLEVVPGAGHSVAGDNPKGFAAAVVPFLSEHSPPKRSRM